MTTKKYKLHVPSFHSLTEVCNGGHLHHLLGWEVKEDPALQATPTAETIVAVFEQNLYQTKAIAIIQPKEQVRVLKLFQELSQKPFEFKRGQIDYRLEARRLDHWRQASELWMIRAIPVGVKWEDSN